MEIRQQYLQRYLHDIAVDQLVADYQAKGYKVNRDESLGNYQPDLVARKGDEVIVLEVKAGKLNAGQRKKVAEISDYVRNHKNYKFLVVLATPPKSKKIEIPNLDHILLHYLIHTYVSDNLNRLSSYARIIDVPDTVVNELTIADDGSLFAKGNGTIEVELQYSSPNADGTSTVEVFPFTFDVVLKYNQNQELLLADAKALEIDVSSFYE